jgi:quinol monooxygenase YgiN
VRIDIFEQTRRGAHFSVVETWASPQALDRHAGAASTLALTAAIKRVGASGYDQRPYKPLTTAEPRATNPQAVYVVTHVDTIPAQGSDPAGLLRALAEKSRSEPGNLRFDVLQHAMRANHFTIVETWENPAAADAHEAASHTRQYRLDIQPLTGSPVDERVFRAVE